MSSIGREKDIIERALQLNPKFTKEDYEDVFKSFKNALKEQVISGEHTGYKFPCVGTMYLKMDDACKKFTVRYRKEITNWQIRYEKILKEIMERTLTTYRADLRLRKGFVHHLKIFYGFEVEDIERIQNEEFNK